MSNKLQSEMGTLPNSDKTPVISAQLEKQIENKKRKKFKSGRIRLERGVIFLKNIPKGFYEEQMKDYFTQFGRVTRIRLVRSKRTGNSKGFAYVEFEYPEVAKEAALSLQNRLMFNKIVKAVYIPPEEQKYDYFKTRFRAVRSGFGKFKLVSSIGKPSGTKGANYLEPGDYFSRLYHKNRAIEKLKDKFVMYGLNPEVVPDTSTILRKLDGMAELRKKTTKETNDKRKQRQPKEQEPSSSDDRKNTSDSRQEHKGTSPKAIKSKSVIKGKPSPGMKVNISGKGNTEITVKQPSKNIKKSKRLIQAKDTGRLQRLQRKRNMKKGDAQWECQPII